MFCFMFILSVFSQIKVYLNFHLGWDCVCVCVREKEGGMRGFCIVVLLILWTRLYIDNIHVPQVRKSSKPEKLREHFLNYFSSLLWKTLDKTPLRKGSFWLSLGDSITVGGGETMATGVRAQGRGHVCKPTARKQQEMNAGTQLAFLFTQSGPLPMDQ